MADKSFILTVVAVLAIAVLAGSLRNSYSGALSSSGPVGLARESRAYDPYSATAYKGNLQQLTPYQTAVRRCNDADKDCRAASCPGPNCKYCTTERRNCIEAEARNS